MNGVHVNVNRLSIPDCDISNVFFLCMSMSVSLYFKFLIVLYVRDGTIRNGQSRDTDIDMHNKKTLEIVQLCMDNLQTLTLTYTRIIPDCSISNVFFLCMSMSVSVDSQGMIVLSLRSFSCVCQCQCL
jgi:hypothetical protein